MDLKRLKRRLSRRENIHEIQQSKAKQVEIDVNGGKKSFAGLTQALVVLSIGKEPQ